MSFSRRAFLENGAIVIATAGISSVAWSDSAPMLSESDPTAAALGYSHGWHVSGVHMRREELVTRQVAPGAWRYRAVLR